MPMPHLSMAAAQQALPDQSTSESGRCVVAERPILLPMQFCWVPEGMQLVTSLKSLRTYVRAEDLNG